jgi:hypothetical protein
VAETMRERIVENLAVASAIGFLALIVAALSLFAASRASAAEREALAPSPASAISLSGVDDPAFDRIYAIRNDGALTFGAVLSLRSPDSSALVGAIFSPQGELRELRYLGACASRLPADLKAALGGFVGADESLNRAAEAVRTASRGANAASEAGS